MVEIRIKEVVGKKIVKGGENLNKLAREGKNDNTNARGCGAYGKGAKQVNIEVDDTKGNSEWEGWGTALKPACEPIVVARKPLSEKNVALNVLKWGTGGINIDKCRVETEEVITNHSRGSESAVSKGKYGDSKAQETHQTRGQTQGRFPANIILDEEAGRILDEQTGDLKSGSMKKGKGGFGNGEKNCYGESEGAKDSKEYISSNGGASRFFYCAKASKSERNLGCEGMDDVTPMEMTGRKEGSEGLLRVRENGTIGENPYAGKSAQAKNHHPTVKPIKLMEYLVKLVSKEGATVLDPFLGSGTTAIACEKLKRKWIGIEREEDYIKISEARISSIIKTIKN